MTTQVVTTNTIVNTLEEMVQSVKSDTKLDIEKKVNLVVKLTSNQLRAGALNLGYQKAVSRLPEGALQMVPQLSEQPPAITKQ